MSGTMPDMLRDLLDRLRGECSRPPKGWRCTRNPGHDGPCAAVADDDRLNHRPPLADPKLPCHGCAHSASGAPFPGHSSGERPCGFCIRNPELDPEIGLVPGYWGLNGPKEAEYDSKGKMVSYPWPAWYDGSKPKKWPADNYIATDRLLAHTDEGDVVVT